jgi:signal transduction histidine kinase
MATLQKNTCASDSSGIAVGAAEKKFVAKDSQPHSRPDADLPSPENLRQEYVALRDRFQRTTNALASAAHDLKTPLSILNGYVELLHSEKLGPISERQREVLKDMQASGKRLQQFIQDFLTYSVLETGGLRMQFTAGDLNQCLSEVCHLWSGRFQERGLALYFLANEKLPVFPFDSPKLERVISNLLENAFKFTPQGGTVWLHAEPHMWERRVASEPALPGERRRQSVTQPNAVKVSVADTGPGISAEFHQEVFDDFFRLPSNNSTEGMGLGLAIARRLVYGMGGKIWVESEPGAGCKFSFLIPFQPSTIPAVKGKNNR